MIWKIIFNKTCIKRRVKNKKFNIIIFQSVTICHELICPIFSDSSQIVIFYVLAFLQQPQQRYKLYPCCFVKTIFISSTAL